MCRESINGDNIFVASAFEPEKKVKDEGLKAEEDDMLEVGRIGGVIIDKAHHHLRQGLDTSALGQGKCTGKGKGRAMDLGDEDEPVILPYVIVAPIYSTDSHVGYS